MGCHADFLSVATFVVLVATLGAVAYYALVAKHQLDEMRRTIEVGNRAWLTVKGCKARFASGGAEVEVAFDNTGRSPARGWAVAAAITHSDITLPQNAPDPVVADRSTIVLAPGHPCPLTFSRSLSPVEVTNIRSGVVRLLVYGRSEYEDGFGHTRHTRFSFFSDKVADKDFTISFLFSPKDNFAD